MEKTLKRKSVVKQLIPRRISQAGHQKKKNEPADSDLSKKKTKSEATSSSSSDLESFSESELCQSSGESNWEEISSDDDVEKEFHWDKIIMLVTLFR